MDDLIEIAKQLGEFIGKKLDAIANKEMPPFPEIPKPLEMVSIKNMPEMMKVEVMNPVEMPVTDLSETNDLLKQLINKKEEPVDIKVTLKLK